MQRENNRQYNYSFSHVQHVFLSIHVSIHVQIEELYQGLF